MDTTTQDHRTITKFADETHLLTWLEVFLVDRKAQGLARRTVEFYQLKFQNFASFCEKMAISYIDQVDPNTVRRFPLYLEDTGHNPGGIHAHYRALRAFLNWWEDEIEPEGWKNPIKKVKAPKVGVEPLKPVSFDVIKAMLSVCERRTFTGNRDRAILLALMDTGARAGEFIAMNLEDLDISGSVLIRQGKGGKPRTVFFGKKTRKAVRAYLRKRMDDNTAMWVTKAGERLTYWGLRQIIRRSASRAGVEVPNLHSFRRLFALECLRCGKMSIYELQNLMGHAGIQVLRRYLAITDQDTKRAHRRAGSVDRAGL